MTDRIVQARVLRAALQWRRDCEEELEHQLSFGNTDDAEEWAYRSNKARRECHVIRWGVDPSETCPDDPHGPHGDQPPHETWTPEILCELKVEAAKQERRDRIKSIADEQARRSRIGWQNRRRQARRA